MAESQDCKSELIVDLRQTLWPTEMYCSDNELLANFEDIDHEWETEGEDAPLAIAS